MDSKRFRHRLEEHPIWFFVVLLTGAVASHLAAEFVFDGFERPWSAQVVTGAGIATALTLASVFFLKQAKDSWVWVALGGLLSFQFFCLLVHRVLSETSEVSVDDVGMMLASLAIVAVSYWSVSKKGKGTVTTRRQLTAEEEQAAGELEEATPLSSEVPRIGRRGTARH